MTWPRIAGAGDEEVDRRRRRASKHHGGIDADPRTRGTGRQRGGGRSAAPPHPGSPPNSDRGIDSRKEWRSSRVPSMALRAGQGRPPPRFLRLFLITSTAALDLAASPVQQAEQPPTAGQPRTTSTLVIPTAHGPTASTSSGWLVFLALNEDLLSPTRPHAAPRRQRHQSRNQQTHEDAGERHGRH